MQFCHPFRFGTAISALALLNGVVLAQGLEEVKVPPTSRHVEDIKPIAAPHPVKTDARPGAQAVFEGECLAKPSSAVSNSKAPDFTGRVLFDEPGDGALWVRGGNSYKARFDTSGATYIPYLGSDAPQAYPVHFVLEEVSLGGQALAFDPTASYRLDGNVVSFDRGGLVEVYDMRSDSMEQVFVLDELSRSGDLVVRISVDTQLAFGQSAQGFVFENEIGGVSYGRATVVDGLAQAMPVQTEFVDGGIEIRVPASFLASAALPLTIDPVVSTFPVDTDSTVNAWSADVAYDETNNRYTVVWEQLFTATDHDVYSTLLDSAGALIAGSEVTIDFTTDCWTRPRVANNQISDSFLVVAQTSTNCASPWIIEGRTRNAGSNTIGLQFQISGTESGDKINPDVGGDPVTAGPTYFCVVWERIFLPADHDVHYNLVRADSTLLNATTQLLQNDTDDQRNPTVSKGDGQRPFSTQEWNVVWEEVFTAGLDNDIYGGQIHWDGSITTGPYLIDFSGADDRNPEASTQLNDPSGATRDTLVVYDRGPGNTNDIQGTMVNAGTTVSASTNLSTLDSPFAATRDQIQPAADTDGNCFAVVYSEQFSTSLTDYDIYISTFTWDGVNIAAGESHQNLAFSVDGEYDPRLTATLSATDGTPANPQRFCAAWTDQFDPFGTPGNGDIEGALYDTVCSTCSVTFPPCPVGVNSTGGPALISLTTDCNVATNDTLTVTTVPNQPGIFYHGPNDILLAFGNGNRCVGGFVVRHPVTSGSGGVATETFVPAGYGILPGSSVAYQYWFRDPAGGGSFFDLSNSVRVQY